MRYSAQRFGTWEWLDFEVPFDTEGPEWSLSNYGSMEATIAPEIGLQRAEDGRLILEEWGTFIHCEVDSRDRTYRKWTGIVTKSELDGKEWRVTIDEFPAFLDGQPIETLIRGVEADPADLVRQLWQDQQMLPNSWHGVTVTGTTPTKLGTTSDDEVARARAAVDGRKQTLDSFNKDKNKATKELQDDSNTLADELDLARKSLAASQKAVLDLVKDGAPAEQIASARAAVKANEATVKSVQTAYNTEVSWKTIALKNARKDKEGAQQSYDRAKEIYDAAKEKARNDGGAYEIRPDDTPDAFQSLNTLAEAGDFEWTTDTVYTVGPPKLEIKIHAGQAGVVRDNLVFEQGVNVIQDLRLVRGEDYANGSLGVGAGEGKESIRGSIPSNSNRMRRTYVFTDKSEKNKNNLLASMRADLKKRSGKPYVPEIEVVDHELAPMFSWNVGDIVLVSGQVPHYGYYSVKHRITGWQLINQYRARLTLELAV